MTLYVEREWAPLERVPFDMWLPHVERRRECYLAVDFWGLYGDHHQLALRAFLDRVDALEEIATVPNDVNLATLLDYLHVEKVAQHLSQAWPPKTVDVGEREVVMPAPIDESHSDVIVLYRIHRDRLDLLDKEREPALE